MEIIGLLIWLASVIAGTIIGSKKGKGLLGFILTFLLGPIGLIIILLIGKK